MYMEVCKTLNALHVHVNAEHVFLALATQLNSLQTVVDKGNSKHAKEGKVSSIASLSPLSSMQLYINAAGNESSARPNDPVDGVEVTNESSQCDHASKVQALQLQPLASLFPPMKDVSTTVEKQPNSTTVVKDELSLHLLRLAT